MTEPIEDDFAPDPTWRIIRSDAGYGWRFWLGPRIRFNSPGALTPMRPKVYRGGDEYCNDTICLHLWPIGGLDIWWRWKQRTEADGKCDECRKQLEEFEKFRQALMEEGDD